MPDHIFESFLRRQFETGMALARASDILDLLPLAGKPPRAYIARFRCKGLVRAQHGRVVEAELFEVAIQFPSDYLRRAEPYQVVSWLAPRSIWHPNILPPAICLGHLTPGTGLSEIVYRIHDIITYRKVTMREDNALNHAACQWARANSHRFPVDERPLKRRELALRIETINGGGQQ